MELYYCGRVKISTYGAKYLQNFIKKWRIKKAYCNKPRQLQYKYCNYHVATQNYCGVN